MKHFNKNIITVSGSSNLHIQSIIYHKDVRIKILDSKKPCRISKANKSLYVWWILINSNKCIGNGTRITCARACQSRIDNLNKILTPTICRHYITIYLILKIPVTFVKRHILFCRYSFNHKNQMLKNIYLDYFLAFHIFKMLPAGDMQI